jgi:intracellular septation protein
MPRYIASMTDKPKLNPITKLVLDLGPLLLFFYVNSKPALFAPLLRPFLPDNLITGEHTGIFTATAIFIPAILIALAVGYALTRHLPLMPVITAIIVAFGKSLLGLVFDQVLQLTDEGWRKLTLRWGLFFLALAVLNELVWRTQSTDFWVTFKVFIVVPLTFVFAGLQYWLLQKYAPPEQAGAKD